MHIHVDGVELNIFTTHHPSGIDFRPVFSSTRSERVKQAIKTAREKCLQDPEVRKTWIGKLEMARVYMLGYEGKLASLANGRMFDFKLIRIALERQGDEYADT